ncbi:MAG: septal ring lytic transglycosylase RlpA family protein [Terriglobales bacterium]
MQRLIAIILLTVALAAAPWAAQGPVPVQAAAPATVASAGFRVAPPPYQVGIASWYGAWFQGKETTSGERFNMYALTAAHRQLPFGTRVRVTNLTNHRSVVLRINDRGPVPASRVIDLSFAAARALGFYEDGLIPVRIDLVPQLGPERGAGWIGAFGASGPTEPRRDARLSRVGAGAKY